MPSSPIFCLHLLDLLQMQRSASAMMEDEDEQVHSPEGPKPPHPTSSTSVDVQRLIEGFPWKLAAAK